MPIAGEVGRSVDESYRRRRRIGAAQRRRRRWRARMRKKRKRGTRMRRREDWAENLEHDERRMELE